MIEQGYFTKSVPCVTELANILHIHPKYNYFWQKYENNNNSYFY